MKRTDFLAKMWSIVGLSFMLAFGGAGGGGSTGEVYPAKENCAASEAAPASFSTAVTPVTFSGSKVTVTLNTPVTDERVFYVVLLTTDLTAPLDETGSTGDSRRGRTVLAIKNAGALNGKPIVIDLDFSALNERFYVAVCS